MKFSDCLSAMVSGREAVKDGTRRTTIRRNGRTLFVEAPLGRGWSERDLSNLDMEEDGWEIEAETMDVCGISFTHRSEFVLFVLEETWISEERGIRIRRLDGGWECSTTGNGPRLVRSGPTAEVAVGRLLDEAKEAARMAARVLGTAEVSK